MSFSISAFRNSRDRLFTATFLDENNESERRLCNAVDAAISNMSRTLHDANEDLNNSSSLMNLKEQMSPMDMDKLLASPNGEVFQPEPWVSPTDSPEAAFRMQVQSYRDILRRVDGERRHLRRHCLRLMKEQDQTRGDIGTLQRYSTDSHQRAGNLERQLAAERQRRRVLEDKLDSETQEVMRLRRFIRSLPSDLLPDKSEFAPEDGVASIVPDRRFEEAFKDKMSRIVYKRRYRKASDLHRKVSEQLETLQMEQEDAEGSTVTVTTTDTAMLMALRESSTPGDDFLGSSGSTAFSMSNSILEFPFQLPFSTATPEDAHVKSLIYHSKYAEPLTHARDHLLRLTSRLKVNQDSCLRFLYTLYLKTVKHLSTNAAGQLQPLFERNIEKLQRSHRDLLFGVVEHVNNFVTGVCSIEKGERQISGRGTGGVGRAITRRDVGCSASMSTTMEEYRSNQLKDQLVQMKVRASEVALANQQSLQEAVLQRSTAQKVALASLNGLKQVSDAMTEVVQGSPLYSVISGSPFDGIDLSLTSDVLEDPRLPTKVGEAVDRILYCVVESPIHQRKPHSSTSDSGALSTTADGNDVKIIRVLDSNQPTVLSSAPNSRNGAKMSSRLASNFGRFIDVRGTALKAQKEARQQRRSASFGPKLQDRQNRSSSSAPSALRRRQTVIELPPMAVGNPAPPATPPSGQTSAAARLRATTRLSDVPVNQLHSHIQTQSAREGQGGKTASAHGLTKGDGAATISVIDLAF